MQKQERHDHPPQATAAAWCKIAPFALPIGPRGRPPPDPHPSSVPANERPLRWPLRFPPWIDLVRVLNAQHKFPALASGKGEVK